MRWEDFCRREVVSLGKKGWEDSRGRKEVSLERGDERIAGGDQNRGSL
jgi:hypothetical protein